MRNCSIGKVAARYGELKEVLHLCSARRRAAGLAPTRPGRARQTTAYGRYAGLTPEQAGPVECLDVVDFDLPKCHLCGKIVTDAEGRRPNQGPGLSTRPRGPRLRRWAHRPAAPPTSGVVHVCAARHQELTWDPVVAARSRLARISSWWSAAQPISAVAISCRPRPSGRGCTRRAGGPRGRRCG